MQTFLPFPDFKKSAKVLDRLRLGCQRKECLQLLRGQWKNHPSSKMWRGHEFQLAQYGIAICDEWLLRGYQDTCYDKILTEQELFKDTGLPKWFGNEAFHKAHRSKLLEKNLEYYSRFFPDDKPGLEYVWPV